MLEGLYSAAAGMEAQQDRLDAISNDLANADTPGFQTQRVGFEDLLYNASSGEGAGVAVGAGSAAVNLGLTQTSGGVVQTGQPLDLAIDGNAYFEVKQPNGTTALTLNGEFGLDAKGRLTTGSGLLVQPPITIPPGINPSELTVGGDGTISAGGKSFGKIALVTVAAPGQLTPSGDSLLVPNSQSGQPKAASGATILQGSLNNSNVDLATTMTQMMDAQQTYSLTSRAIDIQAQMLQIANQLRG